MKRKPTGFVAVCQCGATVGAMDFDRTDQKEAGRLLGTWLFDGCTVVPQLKGGWSAHIESCRCEQLPSHSDSSDSGSQT